MLQTSPIRIHDTIPDMSNLADSEQYDQAYHKVLVAYTDGEIAVECYSEVIRIVTLVSYDMLQQSRLMSQDFCQSSTVKSKRAILHEYHDTY